MNKLKQQIKIAEFCGWKQIDGPPGANPYWNNPQGHYAGGGSYNPLPEYTQDRQAMAEALEVLQKQYKASGHSSKFQDCWAYESILAEIVLKRKLWDNGKFTGLEPGEFVELYEATPAQQAEALLKAIHQWEEE